MQLKGLLAGCWLLQLLLGTFTALLRLSPLAVLLLAFIGMTVFIGWLSATQPV
jgi:hypothetical protein